MRSALIVGSGPSAAGAAIALSKIDDCQITVIDVGLTLEEQNRAALRRLSAVRRQAWSPHDLRVIARQPEASTATGVPQKHTYGSDYPFRNVGQRSGLEAGPGVNDALVSGAYGGFSNVWGAGILPFPDSTFDHWPISAREMASHYRDVLSAIPFSATVDDLAEDLPLHANSLPLPALSARATRILNAYGRHRVAIRRAGIVIGQSRMALRSNGCVRCGLCMTGCPYSLIYSAADTFDELLRSGRIVYHPNLLAIDVQEQNGKPRVTATNLRTGACSHFTADRVYLACGAIGTTRLVLGSLRRYGEDAELQESAQFILPFAALRPTADPRRESQHTLAQLFIVLKLLQMESELVHISLYTYNPAFDNALPVWARPFASSAFRRLSVGLGFLPSSISPRLRVRLTGPGRQGELPPVSVQSANGTHRHLAAVRQVGRQLLRTAPRLDLWPLIPRMTVAAPGKSYHAGGSFPHGEPNGNSLTTDRVGRLRPWERVHIVDPSVLPSIAATTFTLTAMANAHRIAQESWTMDPGLR